MRGAILLCLAALASSSELDEYIAKDKQHHAAAGFLIGATSGLALRAIDQGEDTPRFNRWQRFALALAPVVVAAVGKEMLDRRDPEHHSCDFRDAAATVLGGTVSVSLTLRW